VILKGEKIELEPMTKVDIPTFFKWATESDASAFWYGALYGTKIPTYEEFLADWKSYYFDGSEPEKGRSFFIKQGGKPIGQINYNDIDRKNNSVELDILIAEKQDKGKGFGSDALKTLVNYLFQSMNLETCWIEGLEKNARAISAYKKAGFKVEKEFKKEGNVWVHLRVDKSASEKSHQN